MNRLFIDFKENCHGELDGTIKMPKDSTFALEAFAEALRLFSINCEVPIDEMLKDIRCLIK